MNNFSDYELNVRIAKTLYPLATISKSKTLRDGVYIHHSCKCPEHLPWILDVSYCKGWKDLMPLVIKHDIDFLDGVAGFNYDDGRLENRAGNPYHEHNSPSFEIEVCNEKKPQRALAECLLKVLENKQ